MERQVTILKRAEIKKASAAYGVNPGDVVYLVKGSTDNVYMTTLRRNKRHSCLCQGNAKWHKTCYHISHLRNVENERQHTYMMSDDVHSKLASIAKEAVIEAAAPDEPVEHKITEVEPDNYIVDSKHSVWYCFSQEKWHCSCSSNCTDHIELVKNKMHREAQASLAKSTLIETVLVDNNPPCKVEEPIRKVIKRKRKDLLDKITEERELKFQILGEIREIQERAASEKMAKAALTKKSEPFRILK